MLCLRLCLTQCLTADAHLATNHIREIQEDVEQVEPENTLALKKRNAILTATLMLSGWADSWVQGVIDKSISSNQPGEECTGLNFVSVEAMLLLAGNEYMKILYNADGSKKTVKLSRHRQRAVNAAA